MVIWKSLGSYLRTILIISLLVKPVDVAAELRADVVLQAESQAVVLLLHTVPARPGQVLNFPDQCSPLSLVEECRGSTLIGREDHSVATPALLCHKEPARASKAP